MHHAQEAVFQAWLAIALPHTELKVMPTLREAKATETRCERANNGKPVIGSAFPKGRGLKATGKPFERVSHRQPCTLVLCIMQKWVAV
ncbi:MAG: hypothetical protein KME45_33145 [Stenomitos rutilans HA7619-LM2]|nr:hypothetical protein [Stenomitos rutilans HA7619-LM2]